MSFLDDLANSLGISSKSLGINTAEDKAAREAEAQRAAQAKYEEEQRAQLEQSQKAQAEYEAMQKAQLEEMRQAQGDYQEDQTPGLGSKILSGLGISSKALDSALGTRTTDLHNATRQPTSSNLLEQAYGGGLASKGSFGTLLGIAGAAAPVLGGIGGYFGSKDLRDQSQQAYKDMVSAAGQDIKVGPSAAENLQDNQQDLAARAKAMALISQRADMGLTPSDLAMLQQARATADQQAQSQFAKSQTDLARRGMSQSPALMLAQAQGAGQDAAARQQLEAQNIAQKSFEAKQAAAKDLGTQAGLNLQQDFNRGILKAQNIDQISKFNAEQQQAKANRLQTAGQVQGTQLGQAAAAKAQAFAGIGQGIGQAVGTYQQNQQKK